MKAHLDYVIIGRLFLKSWGCDKKAISAAASYKHEEVTNITEALKEYQRRHN